MARKSHQIVVLIQHGRATFNWRLFDKGSQYWTGHCAGFQTWSLGHYARLHEGLILLKGQAAGQVDFELIPQTGNRVLIGDAVVHQIFKLGAILICLLSITIIHHERSC